MFSGRSEEPLMGDPADAALDREIARALQVEPAPDFVARVRTRLVSERPPADGWDRWRLAFGSAVVASAGLAAVLWTVGSGGDTLSTPDRSASVAFADRRLPARNPEDAARVTEEREVLTRSTEWRTPGRASAAPRDTGPSPASTVTGTPAAPSHFLAFTPEELTLPEVVIHPAERRAIRLLMNPRESQSDRPGGEDRADEIVIPNLPALAELEVPDVHIVPLAQMASAEGGRP
jgi:hypothetical protein